MFALLAATFATQIVISGATDCTSGATTCAVDGSKMELQETIENGGANLLQYQGNSKDGNSIEKLDRSTAFAGGCDTEKKHTCKTKLNKCKTQPHVKCAQRIARACDGCSTTVKQYAKYEKAAEAFFRPLKRASSLSLADLSVPLSGESLDSTSPSSSKEHNCAEIGGKYNIGDLTKDEVIEVSMTVSTKEGDTFISGLLNSTGLTLDADVTAKINQICYGRCIFHDGDETYVPFQYNGSAIAWNNGAFWPKIE